MAKTHLLKYLRETFFDFWRKSSSSTSVRSSQKAKFEIRRELNEWFPHIEDALNSTNIYYYELTRTDGENELGVLPVDSEDYKAQKKALEQKGNLKFPFKNTIILCDEANGEKIILDPNLTSSQRPETLALLKGIHASNNTPLSEHYTDDNQAGLGLIRHLESIKRDFHPNFHSPLAGHLIELNMRIVVSREGYNFTFRTRKELVPEKDNPLVFEEQLLHHFYLAFNNYLWKDTNPETFKNCFRVTPIGMLECEKISMTAYFCYAFGKIDSRMIKELKPKNLNVWIKPVINGNNYNAMKSRAKDKVKINKIDNLLKLI